MAKYLLVLTTFPDLGTAQQVARHIVRENLAACVNILPQAQSIYMWQSRECVDTEHIVLIKTIESNYLKLESYIRSQHPYELPEIIATPITKGLEDYLTWMAKGRNI